MADHRDLRREASELTGGAHLIVDECETPQVREAFSEDLSRLHRRAGIWGTFIGHPTVPVHQDLIESRNRGGPGNKVFTSHGF